MIKNYMTWTNQIVSSTKCKWTVHPFGRVRALSCCPSAFRW